MNTVLNQNKLTIAKPLAEVKGMLTLKSAKTGASRIQLMSKRDFTKAWVDNPKNANLPKKQAARDFDAYRTATLDAFNAGLAVQIANGNIRAERITADKTGDLRTISLMRPNTRIQDSNRAALAKAAELTGVSLDTLIAQAKKHAPDAVTEVVTTEVATPSAEEQKTEPAAPASLPAEQNAPVSVAAAA